MADYVESLTDYTQSIILNIILSPQSKRASRFDSSKGLVFDIFELADGFGRSDMEPNEAIGIWKYERGYKFSRPDLVYEAMLYFKKPYGIDFEPIARLEMEYDKKTDVKSREIFYFDMQNRSADSYVCDMVYGLNMVYDHDLEADTNESLDPVYSPCQSLMY